VLIFIAAAPVGYWLMIPLEARFPAPEPAALPTPYGIIALGGDSGHRLDALARLSLLFPQAHLLYSGRGDRAAATLDIRHVHLDPLRVILETHSRTTLENAHDSARLVKPRPDELWFLITSAAHMPRAIACFRAAGFRVMAYPVDFVTHAIEGPIPFGGTGPAPLGMPRLEQLDEAAKEWIGLLAYRIVGATNALFPGH